MYDESSKIILGSGLVIVLISMMTALSEERPPWRIMGGGIGMIVLLSLLATAGGGMARIAAGLSLVTAGTVVMTQAVPLFDLASSIGEGR